MCSQNSTHACHTKSVWDNWQIYAEWSLICLLEMDSLPIHSGHTLVEIIFFLQEKALHVPQFANTNLLICNKCFAGLPCLSQFTPEVSSLETNAVTTRRWYSGYPHNISKAAQGTKEERSPGINLQTQPFEESVSNYSTHLHWKHLPLEAYLLQLVQLLKLNNGCKRYEISCMQQEKFEGAGVTAQLLFSVEATFHWVAKSTNRMFMSTILKYPHQVIKHKDVFTRASMIVPCHITKFMAHSLEQTNQLQTGLFHTFMKLMISSPSKMVCLLTFI